MLRICISGLTCSGKDALGGALAKELNIMYLSKHSIGSFKDNEKEILNSLIQTGEGKYAKAFDDEFVAIAEKNECVTTAWLGPWLIKDATIRIWLLASFDERAQRYAARENKTFEEAKEFVKNKDENTINAFKELYKIDVREHEFFDMMLNTEKLNTNEAVSLIAMLAIGKEEKRFR